MQYFGILQRLSLDGGWHGAELCSGAEGAEACERSCRRAGGFAVSESSAFCGGRGEARERSAEGSFDFEPPDWYQYIYESELVFVKSEDKGAFEIDYPEATLVPQDDLDEEDEKSVQQDEQDAVPERHPRELPLNPVGAPDKEARISKIILRGSRTASQHQELMCVLRDGGGNLCLRFSRNQASDTAQWNATLSYQDLPVLESHDVDISVGQALAAFHAAHDSIQAYEQGDCQAFAEEILENLGLGS